MRNPIFILAMPCLFTAAAEWLVRRTWLRHPGTALLVILITQSRPSPGRSTPEFPSSQLG